MIIKKNKNRRFHQITKVSLLLAFLKIDLQGNGKEKHKIQNSHFNKTSKIIEIDRFQQCFFGQKLMFKHSRLTEYFAEPLIVGISTQTDLLLFIALKILNMSGVETHLMLLKVNLKQINLSVRFPCTLSFQLKAQGKSSQSRGSYELQHGTCEPDETLRLEVQIEKSEDVYRDKQVKIIIYMTSSNGKIPAGAVVLVVNPSTVPSQPQCYPVQKCPDRSATLTCSYSLDFLRAVQTRSNPNSKAGSPRKPLQDSGLIYTSRLRLANGSPSYKSMKNSDSFLPKNSVEKGQHPGSASLYQITRAIADHDSNPNQAVNFFSNDTENINTKEREGARSFVENSQKFLHTQINEHLVENLKSQLSHLQNQNDTLKSTLRKFQRKQKQNQQIVFDLQNQVTRNRNKIAEFQKIKKQYQIIVEEKDRVIKQYIERIKKLEEDIQDLKVSNNLQTKRTQSKEITLKQELQKLKQKYIQSESERQNAFAKTNQMLEQLELSQKKNQNVLKEKERAFSEQRAKFSKKIQQIQRALEQSHEKNQELQNENEELKSLCNNLKGKLEQQHNTISQLTITNKELLSKLQKQKEFKAQLQRQIEKLQQTEQQFIQLKRNYQQLENNDQIVRKKLESSQKTINTLQSKQKQLQDALLRKSQEVASLTSRNFSLTNQLQSLQAQYQEAQQQQSIRSQQCLQSATRLQELKSQLQQVQIAYGEMETQMEQQIQYMAKRKEYLQAEIEEVKEQCDKFREQCEEYGAKNSKLSEEILDLNRKVLELEQKLSKTQQQLSQQKSQNSTLTQQTTTLTQKNSQISQKLSQKTTQAYELSLKVSKMETDLYHSGEKWKHSENFLQSKLNSQQQQLKNKQLKLQELVDKINALQIQILGKDEKISVLSSNLSTVQSQCTYLRQQLKSSKKQQQQSANSLLSLQQQIHEYKDKIQFLQSSLNDSSQLISTLQKSQSQQQSQWESRYNQTVAQVQHIAYEIGKQSEQIQFSFSEGRLNVLLAEGFKKRNAIFDKYQREIKEANNVVKGLEEELGVVKKTAADREGVLEEEVLKEKQKCQQLREEFLEERQQILEKVSTLEDRVFELTSQYQKTVLQLEQTKSQLLQSESLANELQFESNNYRNQLKSLQGLLKNQKEQNPRLKRQYQNSLIATSEESSIQVQRMKKSILDGEKKIGNLERVVGEKEEEIKKLESSLYNLTLLKQKSDQKITQLTQKLSDLSTQKQNLLQLQKSNEKTIQTLSSKLSSLESSTSQTKQNLTSTQSQISSLQTALSQKQSQNTSLKQTISQLQQALITLHQKLHQLQHQNKQLQTTKNHQITKLQQKIVQLSAQVELQQFEVQRAKEAQERIRGVLDKSQQEVKGRKRDNAEMHEKLMQEKNKCIQLEQQIQILEADHLSLNQELKHCKQTIENLELVLDQNRSAFEVLDAKDRQLQKAREQLSLTKTANQKIVSDLKTQISQLKKQLNFRTAREQQSKKRIRQLQSSLQNLTYELQCEHNQFLANVQQQKSKLSQQIENMGIEWSKDKQFFQTLKIKLEQQLNKSQQQIQELNNVICNNQEQLGNRADEVETLMEKIKSLEEELFVCGQQWRKEKSQYIPTETHLSQIESQLKNYQKYSQTLQKKLLQLTQLAKRRLNEQFSSPSSMNILRQVSTLLMRTKTRVLLHCGEKEKESVLADFKAMQEKIQSGVKGRV